MEYIWKTTYRSIIKSILFFLLLAMVSALLCIGLNLKAITRKNVKLTKNAFQIIATLNTESVDQDKVSSEYDLIKSLPYVSVYEPSVITASSKQFIHSDKSNNNYFIAVSKGVNSKQELYYHEQLIIAFTYLDNDLIHIDECIYGENTYVGANVKIENLSSYPKVFEEGQQYIAYGKIKSDYIDMDTLLPKKIDQNSIFQAFDYSPDYYISNGIKDLSTIFHHNKIYKDLPAPYCGIEIYENHNNYWEDIRKSLELGSYPTIVLSATDVKNIYDFHEGKAWLNQGDFFQLDDYENGSFKCLIDENTAKNNKIRLGDVLKLHFYISLYPSGDWFLQPSSYAPSYPEFWNNTMGEAEFEVIGIFDPNNDSFEINENSKLLKDNMIIIPEQAMLSVVGDKTMKEFRLGNYLGWIKNVSVRINPDYIDQFLKEIKELEEIKVTVYDQGFSSVKSTIQHFDELAQLIIVLSGICSILMIGVFIFLEFVKRRTDVLIMNALGCGKKRIIKYLLLAALILSIPATATGATIGYYTSGSMINQIQEKQQDNQSLTSNAEYFGNSKSIDIKLNLETEFNTILISFLVINLFIIIFSIIGIIIHLMLLTNTKKTKSKWLKAN